MPIDLEQVRVRYGENGVKTVERTRQKAEEIISQYEIQKGKKGSSNPGPVLSGVTDPLTGQTYFGQNFKGGELKGKIFENFQNQLHPLLKQQLEKYSQKLDNQNIKVEDLTSLKMGGEPGGHSEIRALDAALKARDKYTGKVATKADLASFLLHNRSLKNSSGVPPRCVHCWHITDGVTVIGND